MLPLKDFTLPFDHGKFGAVRKYDIHSGIDLYCKPKSNVYAIESGTVVRKGPFTGPMADSPWWAATDYIVIKGESGFILYGEIHSNLNIGQKIEEGEVIATVKTVLKKDKGLPMTMLHLELYNADVEPVIWQLNCNQPVCLEDPTSIVNREFK